VSGDSRGVERHQGDDNVTGVRVRKECALTGKGCREGRERFEKESTGRAAPRGMSSHIGCSYRRSFAIR